MTLEEIKEIAKALIIVREFIGNSAEDSKAIQSDLERALIRVHNEALEAAALTVNPGHEHNPNNTPCDGCLLEEASFDVLDLIIHPTSTSEQDK